MVIMVIMVIIIIIIIMIITHLALVHGLVPEAGVADLEVEDAALVRAEHGVAAEPGQGAEVAWIQGIV